MFLAQLELRGPREVGQCVSGQLPVTEFHVLHVQRDAVLVVHHHGQPSPPARLGVGVVPGHDPGDLNVMGRLDGLPGLDDVRLTAIEQVFLVDRVEEDVLPPTGKVLAGLFGQDLPGAGQIGIGDEDHQLADTVLTNARVDPPLGGAKLLVGIDRMGGRRVRGTHTWGRAWPPVA